MNISLKSRRLLDLAGFRMPSLFMVSLAAVSMVSTVHAAPISLYDTSGPSPAPIADSLSGYTGQTTFNNVQTTGSGSGSTTLNILVDYAVFAPGEFANSPLGLVTPSSDFSASTSDYVYAYQIFNSPASTTGLLGLSIGFNPNLPGTVDDAVGETDVTLPSNLIVPYSAAYVESDATLFSYYPTMSDPDASIAPGDQSYFLLTSSPYSPFFAGTLEYGAYTTNVGGQIEYLSSPSSVIPVAGAVPEPASLGLLAVGGLALLGRRHRWARIISRRV